MLASEENRLFAIEALGNMKEPRVVEHLLKVLPIANQEEKLELIETFRKLKHPGTLPYLKKMIDGSSEYVSARAQAVMAEISGGTLKQEKGTIEQPDQVDLKALPAPSINHFLRNAVSLGASDFHLAVGNHPLVRINGNLIPMDSHPISPIDSQRMLVEILDEKNLKQLANRRNVDFCHKVEDLGRFRTNVFIQRHGMDASFRIIPHGVPSWERVGLPNKLKDLIHCRQGMVLVTGPSGCGKTTTLAAIVDLINETSSRHIITIEDPIEYVHHNKSSHITQREVGSHTSDFSAALRAALREDPDVILVGEMRDLETVRMAIMAAETGHLVLSTLHTTNAASSIDRIVSSFPPQEQCQVRTMISESLKAIISQVLLPSTDHSTLVPAYEVLVVNQAISSLIREGKTFQIPSLQQTGASLGMCLLDQSLTRLVEQKRVDPQAAFARAFKKELIEPFLELPA
jgi:twitching motility protein PilT